LKLLFDENLSHRLVERLEDVYPGSQHVRAIGMRSAPDRIVLEYADLMEMILVTKDSDFDDLSILGSDTAKVLRLDLGNCTTDQIERVLRDIAIDLESMFEGSRVVAIVRS
jgi:predicted nuclease of predicted toxin-antitoxin system